MALLTAEQLARLRDIIRDASTSVAISTTGMEVSDSELQRLVDQGYVDPGDLHNLVLDSFEYGRLMQQLPGAVEMSYQKFINYLAKNPVELTDQERRAFKFLQGRAGQFCVGLGTRYEGEMTLAAADMDQELAEAFRYTLQSEAGQATSRRETIGRLTTRLRQMSDDWARDWGRIASTESHMAHQMGFIENVAEQYGTGEQIAKMPEPTACPDCQRLYLDADGRPRVESVEWWQRNGVANYGLKRADWREVMGAMHPWCQCQVVRVPAGWGFDENWDLVPLEEQTEKSDRPTLTIQTFQKSRKLHYRTTFRGLPISIENRRGSKRYWYDKHTDTKGETLMRWPYGYIRLTEGADGDHVDCYLGPHEDATHAYVVHQLKAPYFKEYDEDKVMLGFLTAKRAKQAYLMHFDSPKFFGTMDAIPIERFVERVKSGALARGKRIAKAKPPRQSAFGWESIPHGKKSGQRRLKPGGGYEYRYPEFEVPSAPETSRGFKAYSARQQEINRNMAADPIAAVSTVYLNVSGGGERARFVPVEGISGLGGRNLGVQITANEVPKSKRAINRFAQHARREGLKLMVDSGEFTRFAAEMAVPGQEEKVRQLDAGAEFEAARARLEKLKTRARPLDFDRVFDVYDRLADAFPAGTVTVVAPDRIGDAAKTAELREQYMDRVQGLMMRGVHFIVPFQARTIEGLERDYVAASEAFGEGTYTIGLPMAKKPMPMSVMIPFMTKLYRAGRFPKLHFLGGSQPEQMAERVSQLVAAAYWSSRGLPEQRVLELARTPSEALRGISRVKTAQDVLTSEAETELEPRLRAWAGAAADDPDFDATEAWVDFFDSYPEEFDLELERGDFRTWARDLVQFDTSTVNQLVMLRKEHALTAEQQPVSGYLEETPKRERHPGTLDRYLQAKEFQAERFIPGPAAGLESLYGRYDKSYLARWRDLVKAAGQFGGIDGYVGSRRTVGTMGNAGQPARTAGANAYAAQAPTDHPYGPDARKKRKKKKRKKKDRSKEKAAVAVSPVSYVDGYVRDHPKVDSPPKPDPEPGRKWLDEEQEKRARGRDRGGFTVHPQDTRP